MVAWLSHAGTLIRAAPAHLRMATSLETRTYDILADSGVVNHKPHGRLSVHRFRRSSNRRGGTPRTTHAHR